MQDFVSRKWISLADLEKVVGKLVTLETAVPAGIWQNLGHLLLLENCQAKEIHQSFSSTSGGMEHVDIFSFN